MQIKSGSVVVQAGRASEVFTDERRAAVEQLVEELKRQGLPVELNITQYIPGRRGISLAEQIAIFVGTSAGSGLIGAVVTDIHAAAKQWARRRVNSPTNSRPTVIVTVQDEDGHVWKFRVTKHGDEEETKS